MLATVGMQFPVMHGVTTILPEGDYETYSEAGYQWNEAEQKWDGLRHAGKTKRGLSVVGTYNYVLHDSFRVIQLAYNLKAGDGARIWRPGMADPTDLFDWVKRFKYQQPLDCTDGLLEAWNVFFESCVWNLYCVPKLGWPPLYLDQQRCCMAKSTIAGYPRSLDNAGAVLRLVNGKDAEGKKLIGKLTVPRKP